MMLFYIIYSYSHIIDIASTRIDKFTDMGFEVSNKISSSPATFKCTIMIFELSFFSL